MNHQLNSTQHEFIDGDGYNTINLMHSLSNYSRLMWQEFQISKLNGTMYWNIIMACKCNQVWSFLYNRVPYSQDVALTPLIARKHVLYHDPGEPGVVHQGGSTNMSQKYNIVVSNWWPVHRYSTYLHLFAQVNHSTSYRHCNDFMLHCNTRDDMSKYKGNEIRIHAFYKIKIDGYTYIFTIMFPNVWSYYPNHYK